ncbi:hypothetical protein EAI80_12865, partial [Catenibacterium sp. co_0103]|uniref:hypothetical protein n=1 Tax=unclassified Catenibacterium TaxID=2643636 RepID=UPI0010D4EF94
SFGGFEFGYIFVSAQRRRGEMEEIMKSITGGDKIVDEIIKKWKVQYKNRSAMLDELNGI